MRIQPFATGPYGTDCYVAYEYDGKRCIVVDAPFPIVKVLAFIREQDLDPEAIFLTHGHFDHIFGLAEARKEYPSIPIFIGEEDMDYIRDGYRKTIELLSSFDPFFLSRYVQPVLSDMPEDFNAFGDMTGRFEIIKTPGHTNGSVSIYSKKENIVFTGDTLFRSSIGRTDIGGNQGDLLKSIRKLSALPNETLVFPGHGPMTDIGTEKAFNPYLH